MSRTIFTAASPLLPLALTLLGTAACSQGDAREPGSRSGAGAPASDLVADGTAQIPADEAARAARETLLDREFPLHGLVTGVQLSVHSAADPASSEIGWLRVGARVRLAGPAERTPTCSTGWYRLHPQGFACAGLGIEVGEAPPESTLAVAPPDREAPLPYPYWYVKDPMTPEYHRPPSRDEQRAAIAHGDRYLELLRAEQERRAERLRAGELTGEPARPAVVGRYLDRGFFLATTGFEVRASRRFVRTVRGTYVKQSNLEERRGSSFTGVELGPDRPLPVAWVVRAGRPLIRRDRADGTVRWVEDEEAEPLERHTVLEGWRERRNIGGQVVHVLDGERYFKDWFVAVAQPTEPPSEIAADEPWVHVSLGQQTLVLYEGARPVFATLVSTGQEGHATPTGVYAIRRKYLANTMSNIGDGQDDRYSIEDVPWTQYFEGSLALHAAFWHERFGLPRSHGCVNVAPRDAHRIFDALWPRVPEGWLGVTTERTTFRASHVVITE